MMLLVADSICGGFGQKEKKSFVHGAAEDLCIEIWDESATGMSSRAYLEHLHTGVSICPEQRKPLSNLDDISIVVISLGNVDGKKSYARKNFLGLLVPFRYRKEKIDPRPYYSKRTWKRAFEKTDNLARHLFRHYARITGNLAENVPLEQTKENIRAILEIYKSKKIILISTSLAREFYFPGAPENFSRINNFLIEQTHHSDAVFFDLQARIDKNHLLEDRFHINHAGHEVIKKDFMELLVSLKS